MCVKQSQAVKSAIESKASKAKHDRVRKGEVERTKIRKKVFRKGNRAKMLDDEHGSLLGVDYIPGDIGDTKVVDRRRR